MRATVFPLGIALLCLVSTCAAQTPPARIRIPAWLEKAGTAPGASDLRATVGGVPAGIVGMKTPDDDLLLILALDLTQDLTQATLAKEALAVEIGNLPARTVVAVMRAQDALKVLAAPAAGRTAAVEAVRSLKISGKAGLLDTLEFCGRTGDAILAKSPVRVAILYVTDSDIQNYRENFTNPAVNSSDTRDLSRKFPEALIQERINKLCTRISRQQTPLFVVHLVYRTDQMNEAYQSGLRQLTDITAGTSLFCRSGAEVAGAIRKTFDTIQTHYSITVAPPPDAPRPLQFHISAAGANAPRVVAYRTQLAARN